MPVIELDPGESYSFSAAPLRAVLNVVGQTGGVQLRVWRDDLDAEEQRPGATRISQTELLVTPMPRQIRLQVVPKAGGNFASGTVVSLSLRTEGPVQTMEQIILAQIDVSALPEHTMAHLEFAAGTALLTVPVGSSARSRGTGSAPEPGGARPQGGGVSRAGNAPAGDLPWLQPGRYALRTVAQRHELPSPPDSWALVADGSASMSAWDGEAGAELVELVSGIMAEWTGRLAAVATYAGAARTVEVADATSRPSALVHAAFDADEPGSCSTVAAGVRHAVERLSGRGAVLVLTDGVPGDIQELAADLAQRPGVSCLVLTTGRSVWNLKGQGQVAMQPWQEELGGLAEFAVGPGRGVVALLADETGRPVVGEGQSAELASALCSCLGEVAR